jgi:hypothetical protein
MAMSAAERVRLSRWVNKVEAVGDELLSLLRQAPEPLPREPVFDPELVEKLAHYLACDANVDDTDDIPNVRFLELGNGHQMSNRDRALRACARLVPGVTIVDRNTIDWESHGRCHFAAFSHPRGAMISSSRSENRNFGGAAWHSKENFAMFRDVGNGRCLVYLCPIQPLFDARTIGHHGVKWEDVEKLSRKKIFLRSSDAIEAADQT